MPRWQNCMTSVMEVASTARWKVVLSPTLTGMVGKSGANPPASNMMTRFGAWVRWASMAAAQGAVALMGTSIRHTPITREVMEVLPDLRIEIVDSRSTSMGQGFQAMAAAEAAQAGASVDEVVTAAIQVRESLHILFMVDTLEFLHRGGRIGGAKRFLGTALQIKPLLGLDGVIEAVEQVRTKKKALSRMLEILRERAGSNFIFRMAVVHANAPEEAQALASEAQAVLKPQEFYMAEVSPVIGTHTGPGTLGICIVTR